MTDVTTYPTTTLAEIAGVNAVTFRQWRSRNDFLPNIAWPDGSLVRGEGRWRAVDICLARLVGVLTEHGIPASVAIWIAQGRHVGLVENRMSAFLEGDEGLICKLALLGDPNNPFAGSVLDYEAGAVFGFGELRSNRFSLRAISDDGLSEAALMSAGVEVVTIIDLRAIVAEVRKRLEKLEALH
jgi:hypothetical protein